VRGVGTPSDNGNLIRKLAWFCVAILSLAVLVASGARLLSDLYASIAVQKRQQLSTSPVGYHAARLAAQLTPWNKIAWSEYSYHAAQSGNMDMAISAISEAIFWQPADAANWLTLAQIKLRAGYVDAQLTAATSYVALLAPNALNLQQQLALEGVYWWPYGNERLRQIWLGTMRDAFRQQKDIFLVAVISSNQEQSLCRYSGRALTLGKWCEWSSYMRQACVKDSLSPDQKNFCQLAGFLGGSQP
jgi:hypothetical protein